MHSPHVDDLLPFYVNQTLSADDRLLVEAHLAGCPQCQEELAFWQAVAVPVTEARQSAEAEAAQRSPILPPLPMRPAARRSSPILRAASLLQAQWRIIHRQAALASGIILLAGLLALPATLGGNGYIATEFVRWLAPLATALGVALLYSPAEAEVAELMESMPTSPRTVLLARLALLFTGNGLAVWLIAALLGPEWVPVATLAEGWLLPMALLSSLSLLLAVLSGPSTAIATASATWIALSLVREPLDAVNHWMSGMINNLAQPQWAIPLITLQLIATLWWVGRSDPARYRAADH